MHGETVKFNDIMFVPNTRYFMFR